MLRNVFLLCRLSDSHQDNAWGQGTCCLSVLSSIPAPAAGWYWLFHPFGEDCSLLFPTKLLIFVLIPNVNKLVTF